MTKEAELLEFTQSLRWNDLPNVVREAVLRLTGDAIANAVAGRQSADCATLESVNHQLYGNGTSSVISGGRTSLVGAVGINAFQTTANTMCDVYRPGLCHVTPEVVPAAFGIVENHDVDGKRFLTAVAAGLEVTTRICQALNYPAFRARGWHSPGIAGAMGASVTAGLLSGLNIDELEGCLGLAGSQAGGSFAAMGTMAVKFHQLRGAQAAVIASMHAGRGLTGSPRVLTSEDGGLLRAFSDAPDPSKLTSQLGESWSLLDIAMRAFPAASSLQSLVSLVLDSRGDVDPSDVTDLLVELPSSAYHLGGEAGWESELRAMQSARFVAAGVLKTGGCWTDLFHEDSRQDESITQFARDHVSVSPNEALSDGAVRVVLITKSDQIHLSCDVPPGDPIRPLNQSQLLEKFSKCFATSPLKETGFDVRRLQRLDQELSIAHLVASLRLY